MSTSQHERILIMPAAGLGDLIMAAPVIRALRQRFPRACLVVLAHRARGAAELAACMPYLDEVVDFPLRRYSWPAVIRFFLGDYWPMLLKLRRKRFDTGIILAPNPIRSILVKMLGLKSCLTAREKGHPTKVGLRLAAQLGCSPEPLDFGLIVPDVPLQTILPESLPRPWIGLHPFSAMSWRGWKDFEQLITKLQKLKGTVILLGKEAGHNRIEGVCDLVNRLSVRQLTAVIKNLDVLASCDSGPMHIGFAVGTATVAIFGPVPPHLRMPLTNADRHCAVYHSRAGKTEHTGVKERCPLKDTGFDDISADRVYREIVRILGLGGISSS